MVARGSTTYTILVVAILNYNPLLQVKTFFIIKVEDIIKMFKDLFINYVAEI